MVERNIGIPREVFYHLRPIIETTRSEDYRSQDEWKFSQSTSDSYSESFGPLLEGIEGLERRRGSNLLKSLVEQQKEQKGELLVLDLMSYGAVHRDLKVRGLSVALTNKRSFLTRTYSMWVNNGFIAGDIRNARTWRAIRQWLDSEKHTHDSARKFDLILARPFGGLTHVPKNEIFYHYIFTALYGLLTNEDGYLLTQFHPDMQRTVEQAVSQINTNAGVEARCDSNNGVFTLVKRSGAPEKISLVG